jgi:hypothetical protein
LSFGGWKGRVGGCCAICSWFSRRVDPVCHGDRSRKGKELKRRGNKALLWFSIIKERGKGVSSLLVLGEE